MSSTEYGSVNTQEQHRQGDEEAIATTQVEQTRWQKCRSTLGTHGHRIFIAWFIVIAITAVLTVSLHFSLLPSHQPVDDDTDGLLDEQCVSDRSWFLALLLSVFFGPFGVDRFYLGYIFLGVLKLVTAGLGGIWWVVDVILIALNVLNDHPNGCHLR
ncbi:hypothetical protein BDC45DRAFT_507927 [Circinella umbellata]|nr:hypothetical protein BDC45DRAFT_507927 [Circinella umbellata]